MLIEKSTYGGVQGSAVSKPLPIFLIYLSLPPVCLEPLRNRCPKYFLFKIPDLFLKLPVLTAGSVFQPT